MGDTMTTDIDRLEVIRRALGLNRKRFAAELGFSPWTMMRHRRNGRMPRDIMHHAERMDRLRELGAFETLEQGEPS
jgi:hypothetical protein